MHQNVLMTMLLKFRPVKTDATLKYGITQNWESHKKLRVVKNEYN